MNTAAPQYFASLLAVSSQLPSDTTDMAASYFSSISCFGNCDPLLVVLTEGRRIVGEPSSRCTGPCYTSFRKHVAVDCSCNAFHVPENIRNQNALSPSLHREGASTFISTSNRLRPPSQSTDPVSVMISTTMCRIQGDRLGTPASTASGSSIKLHHGPECV